LYLWNTLPAAACTNAIAAIKGKCCVTVQLGQNAEPVISI